jgi:hypothetical protein
MPIFDLQLKLKGIEGFCGREIDNYHLGQLLYGDTTSEGEVARQVSRLRSGTKPLEPKKQKLLTDEINALIGISLGSNNPGAARGPLRVEDWDKPAPEFFAELARQYEEVAEDRLDGAHAAIVDTLNSFAAHQTMEPNLIVAENPLRQTDLTRIPISAVAVDPLTLPPKNLRPGQLMTVALLKPIPSPSRGWLFYIRNTDSRTAPVINEWIWSEEKLDNLIFWSASPFDLPQGFKGELPGFPSEVRNLRGEVTIYLIIEPLESPAVQTLLEEVGAPWIGNQPSFEATIHLITQGRKLFQKGHRSAKINYAPPTLYARRYLVR